jgi:hypothetical protein
MSIVLAIRTNGYKGWTADDELVVELPEFTKEAVALWMCDGDQEEANSMLEYYIDNDLDHSILTNSIIMNGEENGWTFVLLNE